MTEPTPETLTIVFTDLVDSTAIRTRLGEERADELGALHFSQLSEAVERHRGRVVKGLGDGVLAIFDSAADAIDSAVDMQRTTDAYSRSPSAIAALQIRVGISAGDITWDASGDIAGSAAVEAARLEALAEGGQILCSELARLIARGRGGHVFAPLGEKELKGLEAPVSVEEVLWERITTDPPLPLPDALRLGPRAVVGREDEIALLREQTDARKSPLLELVMLAGEPGIGKTTLAAAAARHAHENGRTVLFGRCDRDLAVPYRPFVDALEGWARLVGPDAIAARLNRDHSWLGLLSPAVAAVLPPPAPGVSVQADQLELFACVRRWLLDVQPVFVIDDLQWAAEPTVLLIRHLLQSMETDDTVLLATARAEEQPSHLKACLADASSRGRATILGLSGLDLDGVVALCGGDGAAGLLDRTGGNPLFLLALDGADSTGGDESIEAAVSRRVQGIDESVREVLRVAAVAGLDFDGWIVEDVLDLPDDCVLDYLETAVEAGVIREQGVDLYTFSHGLVQEALRDELGRTRRARLHHRIAGALEAREPERVLELAHHYDEAADATKAVEFLLRAAQHADALADHEEAARLHDRLSELLGEPRSVLEHRVAAAIARIGLGRHSRELMEQLADMGREAADLEDLDLQLEVLEYYITCLAVVPRVDEGPLDWLTDDDIDRIGDHALKVRAVAQHAHYVNFARGRYDDATRRLESIAHLVDSETEPLAAAWFHFASMHLPPGPDHLADRIRSSRDATALMERVGAMVEAAGARMMLACFLLIAGDIDGADNERRRAHALIEGRHLMLQEHIVNSLSVLILHARGDFAAADQTLERNIALGLAEESGGVPGVHGIQKFMLLREMGRLREVSGPMQVIARLNAGDAGVWRPGLAALYAELGMRQEAESELEHLLTVDALPEPRDNSYVQTLSFVADSVVATGHRGGAGFLYDLLAPFAGQHVVLPISGYFGPVRRYLGALRRTLGDDDGAETLLRRAIGECVTSGTPVYEARSRLALAELLSDAGRAADAVREATTARDIAERLGMATVAARANALLGT